MHKQFAISGMCHRMDLYVLSNRNPHRFIWQVMLYISLWEMLNRNLGSYFYPYAYDVKYQECCYAISFVIETLKGK